MKLHVRVKYSRKMKLKKIIQNILHARLYMKIKMQQSFSGKEEEKEREKKRKKIDIGLE